MERRTAVAGAATVAVAIAVAAGGSGAAGAAGDGSVRVTARDVARDQMAVTARLRRLGLDARALVRPGPPGTFIRVASPRVASPGTDPRVHDAYDAAAEAVAAQRRLDGVVVGRTVVRIPRDYAHPLTLVAGR
jgi:hypothetical protein